MLWSWSRRHLHGGIRAPVSGRRSRATTAATGGRWKGGIIVTLVGSLDVSGGSSNTALPQHRKSTSGHGSGHLDDEIEPLLTIEAAAPDQSVPTLAICRARDLFHRQHRAVHVDLRRRIERDDLPRLRLRNCEPPGASPGGRGRSDGRRARRHHPHQPWRSRGWGRCRPILLKPRSGDSLVRSSTDQKPGARRSPRLNIRQRSVRRVLEHAPIVRRERGPVEATPDRVPALAHGVAVRRSRQDLAQVARQGALDAQIGQDPVLRRARSASPGARAR